MHRHTFFNTVEDAVILWVLTQIGDIIESRGRTVTFVEVGAHDGVTANKLYQLLTARHWRGLSIEPIPFIFEKLKKNYANLPNVTPLNMAIADEAGRLPFYAVVNTEDISYAMFSSLDRDSLIKQINLMGLSRLERDITEILIETDTLTATCQKNGIQNIDILVVDAEAYDDVVVNSLDMNIYQPEIIIVEHKLLPLDRLRRLDQMLCGRGYQRMIVWIDTAYVKADLLHDECLRQIHQALPALIPAYDPIWGGGNWLNSPA